MKGLRDYMYEGEKNQFKMENQGLCCAGASS